jgi:hypothetical protein
MNKDSQYEAPAMMSHEQFVREWENREQRVRTEIYDLRRDLDAKIASQKKMIATADRTIHEQQSVILRIREIPLVGRFIVQWAERG